MTARHSSLIACVAALLAALAFSAAPAVSAAADAASPAPTQAEVSVGTAAPAVTGASTFAGKIEQFDLSKALADGAIVLYFFPKAFTSG
jgi:thioredoxin-dependent peroxiredoxin